MQLPTDNEIPQYVQNLIALVLGAGGVAWLRVVLENRRLSKKEFRETLLDRIRELEMVVSHMQTRMGSLRVEMAHLEVENTNLRERLELPKREEEHVEQEPDRGDDDGKPA